MYGLDTNTQLKIKIVHLLDETNLPLTSLEIQKKLGFGSQVTILNCCHEIKEQMELIYSNGEAYLIISPNLGIQLFRRSSSLQYLYDDFYSSDLFYEIIEQLIQQRQFSTNEFCDKYGVSVSKLKRKIKEINKLVNHYQMHISVSAKVTIKAEEAQLRMFSYAFLYGIHRQFSRIDWIKNKKFIWELSRKILTYLAVSPSEQSLELLSIWLYVQLNAMEQESRLTFTLRQTLLLKTLSIPEKPAFLSEWHQTDWQLLIAFIQTSDIFGYEEDFQPFPPELSGWFDQLTNDWFHLFERYFTPLDEEEKRLAVRLHRYEFISLNFFKIDENFFHQQELILAVQNEKPTYYHQFNALFDTYTQKYNYRVPENSFRFQNQLLICLALCPFDKLRPRLAINLQSDLNYLLTNYLKQQVILNLKNSYFVTFVPQSKQADLVISTTPQKMKLNKKQKFLLVRVPFTEQDIKSLRLIAGSFIDIK